MKREAVLGYLVGLGLTAVALTVLLLPAQEALRAAGPMGPGHEELRCEACHKPAPGTLRQQIQANTRHALGWRSTGADLLTRPVDNEVCLGCHARPDDVHPVSRFYEPRFAEARRQIAPQLCDSCHREHQARRIGIEPTYCRHCHEKLRIENDPISVPHAELISTKDWASCLGCHDYHGNHVMRLRTAVAEALPVEYVLRYFGRDPSPYSRQRKHPARKTAP